MPSALSTSALELPTWLSGNLPKLAFSAAWVLGLLLARSILLRALQRRTWDSEDEQLRAHFRVNQGFVLATVAGLLLLWASTIEAAALSAVAVAAALALATKELLMCLLGSVLRAASKSFTIGDRIEVGTVRGDVVDYGLLSTTILEIGPAHQRTGRTVTVPNSQLLSNAVVNETRAHPFVLHTFTVPVRRAEWSEAQEILLAEAKRACADYQEAATRHMERSSREHGLQTPTTTPRVNLRIQSEEVVELLVRIPTPAREKGRVEQRILREYLRRMRDEPDPGR